RGRGERRQLNLEVIRVHDPHRHRDLDALRVRTGVVDAPAKLVEAGHELGPYGVQAGDVVHAEGPDEIDSRLHQALDTGEIEVLQAAYELKGRCAVHHDLRWEGQLEAPSVLHGQRS